MPGPERVLERHTVVVVGFLTIGRQSQVVFVSRRCVVAGCNAPGAGRVGDASVPGETLSESRPEVIGSKSASGAADFAIGNRATDREATSTDGQAALIAVDRAALADSRSIGRRGRNSSLAVEFFVGVGDLSLHLSRPEITAIGQSDRGGGYRPQLPVVAPSVAVAPKSVLAIFGVKLAVAWKPAKAGVE